MDRPAFRATHAFELIAVRHGQTAWNASGRFQGHVDEPLDATGIAQAHALAAAVADDRIDVAVASDLERARATAGAMLAGRALTVERDARWREMRFGAWEGLTWPEILASTPALAAAAATSPRAYVPPGGETFDAVCERVAEALAALDARVPDGGTALVATHAGPLHALLRVALGEREAEALAVRFEPASITRLHFAPAGAFVRELNRTAAGAVTR